MRALITNDDGIDSHGISVLTAVAIDAGFDVVVAAPHEERSGASASLSALEDRGRLRSTRVRLDDFSVDAFAVHASPALITFVATQGAFGPRPDIVLSGINHGPNTGSAVLHSGTVGAALTSSTHGVPGIALSLVGNADEPTSWETARIVTRRVLDWFVDHRDSARVLNVNIPPVPPSELRGIRRADLATYGAVQAEIGDTDDEFVTVRFDEIAADDESDSDASLVARGWATVTALRPPSAVHVSFDGLE